MKKRKPLIGDWFIHPDRKELILAYCADIDKQGIRHYDLYCPQLNLKYNHKFDDNHGDGMVSPDIKIDKEDKLPKLKMKLLVEMRDYKETEYFWVSVDMGIDIDKYFDNNKKRENYYNGHEDYYWDNTKYTYNIKEGE